MLTQIGFSQVPIGKDLEKGKNELIKLMKNKGFTFFKESKNEIFKYNKETKRGDLKTGKFYYSVLFKEEVEIKIYFNKFENINEVFIFPNRIENKRKILRMLEFGKWEFLYERKSYTGIDKVYKNENYYCLIPNGQIMQINFYKKKP